MTDAARRDEVALSDADEARLVAALDNLRAAVSTYQSASGVDVPVAQRAVQAAEDEMWRLREELLSWVRPSWAPSATLTADWFSDEDSVYDDLTEPTSP